jgi:DNA (cytosine-5)-methyltransferase 1
MYRASPRETEKLSSVLSGISDSDINHKPVYHRPDSKHHRVALRIKPGQKLCNVRSGPNSVPTWEIPEVFGSTNSAEKLVLEAIRQLRRTERKRPYGDADPVSVDRLATICASADTQTIDNLRRIGYLRAVGDEIDLTITFNGKYRRLRADDVSPTVDTRFGDIQLFLHPLEHRGMTVREAARIQGFSDSIEFPRNEKTAFRLIGNAVPPPMAFELAKYCRALL